MNNIRPPTNDAQATKTSLGKMQNWDGRKNIDISVNDWVLTTDTEFSETYDLDRGLLPDGRTPGPVRTRALYEDIEVVGIEAGDTSVGKLIKIDHEDPISTTEETGTLVKIRSNQDCYVAGDGIIKAPLPPIRKVYNSGTTAADVTIYWRWKRA